MKTLKDFEKELQSLKESDCLIILDGIEFSCWHEGDSNIGAIEMLKHFFDITKGELE